VQIEAGFLTNAEDREAALDPEFRLQLAQRIVAAIKRLRGNAEVKVSAAEKDANPVRWKLPIGAQNSATAMVDGNKVPGQLADGFDYPVGKPNGEGYYVHRAFLANEHLGDDWNGREGGDTDLGDPVFAIGDGLVVFSLNAKMGYGNVVILRHAYAEADEVRYIDSFYAHLDERTVNARSRKATR
jgi:murein DD-endopeptidase MepM/ murein hydrolase activator NlpD